MPLIKLETRIRSTPEICFDLSRSIDLHQISTARTNEKAVEGIKSGLINLGETVTWKATHFGITQQLTSKITAFKRPHHFRDEQVKGAFRSFVHDHIFELEEGIVIMKDIFEFQSPFGIVGRFFNKLVLTKYLADFLIERNNVIKEYAESGKWRSVIPQS